VSPAPRLAPLHTAAPRALLHLALGFHTWRALVREGGLKQEPAVATMVQAIEGAK
jgi:hypothetical protein